MVLAQGAAWSWQTDLSCRARPGAGLSAEPPVAFGDAEREGCPSSPALSLTNASCRVAFLLLSCVLLGLLGSLMPTRVRAGSEASAGFGAVRAGDAEPCPELLSGCCPGVSQTLHQGFASSARPLLGAEHPPKECPGWGPRRWVICELCAVSDGIYRLWLLMLVLSGKGPYLVKEASWGASGVVVSGQGSAGWGQAMRKGTVGLLALCINFNLTSVLFISLLTI